MPERKTHSQETMALSEMEEVLEFQRDQFRRMVGQRGLIMKFQPIADLSSGDLIGYQSVPGSRVFGVETQERMFAVAEAIGLQVNLSELLRVAAVEAAAGSTCLFLNVIHKEANVDRLAKSIHTLRSAWPDRKLVFQFRELNANSDDSSKIRDTLLDNDIEFAFDGFGAAQVKIDSLYDLKPTYLKFDGSLIKRIHRAGEQAARTFIHFTNMVHDLGIRTIADGIDLESEAETCREIGFQLGQGDYLGQAMKWHKLVGTQPAGRDPQQDAVSSANC